MCSTNIPQQSTAVEVGGGDRDRGGWREECTKYDDLKF